MNAAERLLIATLLGCLGALPLAMADAPMAGQLSVRDTGARGDGVADDTRAFQAAVDGSQRGGTVLIPEGAYRLTQPVRLRGERSIIGAGMTASVLRFEGSGPAALLGEDVRDIRLSDFAIQGTKSDVEAEESGGIALRLTHGTGEIPADLAVERVSVSGFRSSGVTVTATGQAVATDVTVRDCAFADLGLHGVLGYFVKRPLVEHCRFARMGRSGTIFPRCWDVTVRGCHVRTTGWHGIEVGDETQGFLIEGNTIEDTGDHAGILAEQAAHRGVIAHNRITRPRFVGIQLNNKPAKAAIKEVTVEGNIIDMGESPVRPAILVYGDTTYTADDCIIEGNTIIGGQAGIEMHYLKRCRIDSNVIRDMRGPGIDLVHLNACGVSGNIVSGCTTSGIRLMPYAEVFRNAEVTLTDNTLLWGAGAPAAAPGILATALQGGAIRGNRIVGFKQGVELRACDAVNAADNDLH